MIGLLATMLLMTKVTFFIGLVPAMTAALFVRKQRLSVVFALGTGIILIAVSTLFLGVTFWKAYLFDLLNVMRSEVRPNVGLALSELLSGAQYLVVTLPGIAAALLIRRAGNDVMGLVVIALLFPGFIFVTYQNFGNDPTWLLFTAFLVLAYRPGQGFAEVGGVDVSRCDERGCAGGGPDQFFRPSIPLRWRQ